jgi:hypothetical protein
MSKKGPTTATLTWRELQSLAEQGELFALVDGRYPLWSSSPYLRLNPKDTDPSFFEIIAWSQVRYKPPIVLKATVEDAHFLYHHLAYERWGLFLRSRFPLDVLRDHFQKFVIAMGPDGDPYFFKFQDGAVLDVFLNSWSQETLEIFWGPVTGIGYMDFEKCELRWRTRPTVTRPGPIVPEEGLLTLTQAQLDECMRRIEQDLVKVISWHLRSEHGALVKHLSNELLDARVAYGIRKARFYRMESVPELAGFVALLFEVGPHFDHHPKVRAILTYKGGPEVDRLQHLVHSMSEEEWQEAGLFGASWGWPKNFKKTGS